MKIGLFLQDVTLPKEEAEIAFKKNLINVKIAKLDLLVFPEIVYHPKIDEIRKSTFIEEEGVQATSEFLNNEIDKISELVGCPIIFTETGSANEIYSYYTNLNAKESETVDKFYLKNVATGDSAFCLGNYEEYSKTQFEPIKYKKMKIAHLICYDSAFPLFSACYGKTKSDVIINSSGGHVDYKKWAIYQRARAIENKCFTLCVMAHHKKNAKNDSHVFGYDGYGKKLDFTVLEGSETATNQRNVVYVFDINKKHIDNLNIMNYAEDEFLDQKKTINNNIDYNINPKEIINKLSDMEQIIPNVYKVPLPNKNLIILKINGDDIITPNKSMELLYHPILKTIPNKKYIIINSWNTLKTEKYKRIISTILKVRASENYVATLCISPKINACFQVGRNKNIQVVEENNSVYGIDLERTTGPEALWKTKRTPPMHASWRENFEYLLKQYLEE